MTTETTSPSSDVANNDAPAAPIPETNSPLLTGNRAIVDDAQKHEIVNPTSQQIAEQPTGDWYYAEGVKGIGDRPEYLNGKFKNALEQAKGYSELEKRFGGFKGAPKDGYSTDIKDLPGVKFDKEDAGLKTLMETCQKYHMGQDVFTDILSMYAKSQLAQIPNKEQELKSLGPNGEDILRNVKTWAHNHLDEQELKTFERMALRADEIKIFNKMRNISSAPQIPAGGNGGNKGYSKSDYAKDVADPRYDIDPQFRAEALKKAYDNFG